MMDLARGNSYLILSMICGVKSKDIVTTEIEQDKIMNWSAYQQNKIEWTDMSNDVAGNEITLNK